LGRVKKIPNSVARTTRITFQRAVLIIEAEL
jgi:hypothetical protein